MTKAKDMTLKITTDTKTQINFQKLMKTQSIITIDVMSFS